MEEEKKNEIWVSDVKYPLIKWDGGDRPDTTKHFIVPIPTEGNPEFACELGVCFKEKYDPFAVSNTNHQIMVTGHTVIWNLKGWKHYGFRKTICTFSGHENRVTAMCSLEKQSNLSDGKHPLHRIISADENGIIYLWDVPEKTNIKRPFESRRKPMIPDANIYKQFTAESGVTAVDRLNNKQFVVATTQLNIHFYDIKNDKPTKTISITMPIIRINAVNDEYVLAMGLYEENEQVKPDVHNITDKKPIIPERLWLQAPKERFAYHLKLNGQVVEAKCAISHKLRIYKDGSWNDKTAYYRGYPDAIVFFTKNGRFARIGNGNIISVFEDPVEYSKTDITLPAEL